MANNGIVIEAAGKANISKTSTPKLREDFIAIKPYAVAVNPTDWKHIDILGSSPGYKDTTVGCDYAGVVEEVGSQVSGKFKKGDRVCGMCHGANALNPEGGAFQDHIVAKGDIQIIIPDNLTFEEAATLGVGITTVGQGLYQSLQLPLPSHPATDQKPVLIYGGSTATGALAIQLAKLSGMQVVVTCSPDNFDYVKELGAEAAFDYKDQDCSKQIKDYTNDNLSHVFDCVSSGNSTQIAVGAMSSKGGVYSALDPVKAEEIQKINPNVKSNTTVAYSALGDKLSLGGNEIAAKEEDLTFARSFWGLARELLADGKLKPHRPSVNQGGSGLEGVMKGLQLGREGSIRGKKLVYTLPRSKVTGAPPSGTKV